MVSSDLLELDSERWRNLRYTLGEDINLLVKGYPGDGNACDYFGVGWDLTIHKTRT